MWRPGAGSRISMLRRRSIRSSSSCCRRRLLTARASMLLIFFATAIAGTLASIWVGLATWRLFLLSLLLFPPMWLGNRYGARHFGRVAPRVWQVMVALVLGVAATSAVVRLLT